MEKFSPPMDALSRINFEVYAPAGNRTRVSTLARSYSTTRPLAQTAFRAYTILLGELLNVS